MHLGALCIPPIGLRLGAILGLVRAVGDVCFSGCFQSVSSAVFGQKRMLADALTQNSVCATLHIETETVENSYKRGIFRQPC